jgi:cell wall-associated NlpC family hydrolase
VSSDPAGPAGIHRRRRRPAAAAAVAVGAVLTTLGLAVPAHASPVSRPAAESTPSARLADPVSSVAATALQSLSRFVRTGDARANAQYVALRSDLASAVAARLGIPASMLRDAWAATSVQKQTALMTGLAQLGVRYRSMGRTPEGGFDCSGFTSFAWQAAGIALPRSSGDQIRFGARRDVTTAVAGDLVQYPGHVMMYLGVPGAVVHSPYTGTQVRVEMLSAQRASRLRYASPTG